MASAVRLAVVAGLASVLVAACATFPTTGVPQPANVPESSNSGAGQNVPRSVPVPPKPDWRPEQVVQGFLAASAAYAGDHSVGPVARKYLYQVSWRPGWAATVVSSQPKFSKVTPASVHAGGQPAITVTLTGQQLATLQQAQYVRSLRPKQLRFGLVHLATGWRISSLPSPTLLLLPEPDFVQYYQPTNLYFYSGPGGQGSLIPDPVFVPQQASAYDRVFELIEALLTDPRGWLAGAATTAFPPGSRPPLIRLSGGIAFIDLQGAAARAKPAVLRRIAAQIVLTLTKSSPSPAGIHSVVLEVNHRPWHPPGKHQLLEADSYASLVPAVSGPAYVQVPGGISTIARPGRVPGRLPLPAALGPAPFSTFAIAPGQSPLFAGCRGDRLFVSAFRRNARLAARSLPGRCATLSWDAGGNLWAAVGAAQMWMIPHGSGSPVPVADISLGARQKITALRVAPDGTRVAMIVKGPAGSQVQVAAITRTPLLVQLAGSRSSVPVASGISSPFSVSWLDADHLAVLARAGTSAQLYVVPVNGGAAEAITTPPGTVSAAGSLSIPLIVIAARGRTSQLWVQRSPDAPPSQAGSGSSPVFAG
jgi:Lipoprotein LpqB beta-propeller domain/Sporulation and spore germination